MGEDMRIVRYKGGLGNQMFQYAFMRSLDSGIHKAGASLGFYKDFPMSRHFELDKVFYNVQLKKNRDMMKYLIQDMLYGKISLKQIVTN